MSDQNTSNGAGSDVVRLVYEVSYRLGDEPLRHRLEVAEDADAAWDRTRARLSLYADTFGLERGDAAREAVALHSRLVRCDTCGTFRSEDPKLKILCRCQRRACARCGERGLPTPGSESYEEPTGIIWHTPWFYQPRFCADCARAEGIG